MFQIPTALQGLGITAAVAALATFWSQANSLFQSMCIEEARLLLAKGVIDVEKT